MSSSAVNRSVGGTIDTSWKSKPDQRRLHAPRWHKRKHVYPHLLRHTTAVHVPQAGVEPSAIRDVLGNASAESTWHYVRVNLEMRTCHRAASADVAAFTHSHESVGAVTRCARD